MISFVFISHLIDQLNAFEAMQADAYIIHLEVVTMLPLKSIFMFPLSRANLVMSKSN